MEVATSCLATNRPLNKIVLIWVTFLSWCHIIKYRDKEKDSFCLALQQVLTITILTEVTFLTQQFTSTMILITTNILMNVGQENLGMNLLFVPPEGFQVEKTPDKKDRTTSYPGGPCTNGHMRGGRSFVAPLNQAAIDPLGGPMLTWRGVMLAGMVTSRVWGMAK